MFTMKEKDMEARNQPSVASSRSGHDEAILEVPGPDVNGQLGKTDAEDSSQELEAQAPRSKLKMSLIMLSLCISVLLVAIDITIVTTALPTISEHFQSASGYTWIGSAYLIAHAAAAPIWGKVSDIFGRKPILLVTNVIFFVGSLLAAVSTSIDMLIAARAIQGIGGGGLVVLVSITISDLVAVRDRGIYFAVIGGVWALASTLGPVVGGLFTQKVSWRWCFYINLPLTGLAFVIIFLVLDVHTPKTPLRQGLKAVDWLGSLVMVSGVVMLLLGLEIGGVNYPWNSATVICLLIFGTATIGLFFLVESRFAPYPLMPTSIFSERSNMAALGVCFLHSFVFISSSFFLPLYFQAVLGATPILSGVYLIPIGVSLSVVSAITGVIIRKTGQYLLLIISGMVVTTLGWGLFIDLGYHSSWAKIILYQIVAGIGVGPNFQAPLIALQSLIPKRDIATATATFNTVRNLGSAISVVVGSVVFQNRMASKQTLLRSSLSPAAADALGGGSAGANVNIIATLPDKERAVARQAFSDSLSTMWIMYVCFSAACLVVSGLITRNVLDRHHEETRTGLEVEEEKRRERERERMDKKMGKVARREDRVNNGDAGMMGIGSLEKEG